jgi:hypothetical protein
MMPIEVLFNEFKNEIVAPLKDSIMEDLKWESIKCPMLNKGLVI